MGGLSVSRTEAVGHLSIQSGWNENASDDDRAVTEVHVVDRAKQSYKTE